MTILRVTFFILFMAFSVFAQEILNPISRIDDVLKNQKPVVFAKLDNGNFVKVINKKWPEGLVESINLFIYQGKIHLIKVIPASESGDWYYGVDNYFDTDGNLIAYIERKNHFNSACIEDSIHRTKVFIKNGDQFKLVKSTILDSHGKDVSNLKCEDPYDFKPELITNLNNYRAKLGIKK